jgi:hypothetical protein
MSNDAFLALEEMTSDVIPLPQGVTWSITCSMTHPAERCDIEYIRSPQPALMVNTLLTTWHYKPATSWEKHQVMT